MSGWWWLLTVVGAVITICVLSFVTLYVIVDRFIDRCLTLLSYHTFMTPCEIACAHAVRYGVRFGDVAMDADMIAECFETVAEVGMIIAQDHEPDENCGCLRAYRLNYGSNRRRKRFTATPSFEWIGGLVPKPV